MSLLPTSERRAAGVGEGKASLNWSEKLNPILQKHAMSQLRTKTSSEYGRAGRISHLGYDTPDAKAPIAHGIPGSRCETRHDLSATTLLHPRFCRGRFDLHLRGESSQNRLLLIDLLLYFAHLRSPRSRRPSVT